jgi:hypothetical protein
MRGLAMKPVIRKNSPQPGDRNRTGNALPWDKCITDLVETGHPNGLLRACAQKFISILLILCIIASIWLPSLQPVFAAPNIVFNPTFRYNQQTGLWEVEWMPVDGAKTTTIIWHEPVGTQYPFDSVTRVMETEGSKISMDFRPDHIHDLTFSFKNEEGQTINFRNKYNNIVQEETVFFLSGMTFEGTSFNEMAVQGGLIDGSINRGEQPKPSSVVSGMNPKIKLRWIVPTIWQPAEGDPEGQMLPVTHKDVNVDRLEADITPHVDIDYCYFHITMNEVRDVITSKNFRTTYDENTAIVRETGDIISGLDQDGNVISADGYVYFILDKADGIKEGTEYEKVNIRLFFWNNTLNDQVIFTRLVYGQNQGYPVENKDNIFQAIEGRIDSLFTPIVYEARKVDVDKLEIRIKKIESRHYSELYYQVQSAGTIIELMENVTDISSGIKLPASSIPESEGWGSIIVEIPLDSSGQHPEHYYRVVVTDGSSYTPLGSLAIDLRMLGNETGKPPVPREIQVQPLYDGKKEVVYENPTGGVSLTIPCTKLRISFEKPLLWMTKPWEEIKSSDEYDFTFHVLLNTYLSDNVKDVETRVIGDEGVTVFVPVKEKRVLTIGKDQLQDDGNRLYFDMDGTNLFYDYVSGKSIDFENDVDYDINGRPDYPAFLIPNTVYYLRMFSTRAEDSDQISWAKRQLGDKISYISPVVSFTTYPSQDLPVPMPNLSLGLSMEPEPDEEGKPVFNGITVDFPKIMDDNDWNKYTEITEGRKIIYDLYISDRPNEDSFVLVETIETAYPDENPDAKISTLVTGFPGVHGEKLKPNTTYYFKMQAKLFVASEDKPFLVSDETPVKSITTPKTDSGSMDDLERKPRAPVEFSIATDENGELELTDAKVTLNWLHAEQDVVYEMVCTKNRLAPDATKDDYINDLYHIGNNDNPGFLDVYRYYKPDADDTELVIDVINTPLKEVGFTYNAGNTRIARFPINLPFLRPNHLYYFSIRAVRNRGTDEENCSDWVSIPVTTKMVKPPDFLEAVNDVQLGFKVRLTQGINPEDMKILLKKGFQKNASYVELSRSKYSVVRDGRDYYIRIYDLEPDTWYDVQPFYISGNTEVWYDSDDKDWSTKTGIPLQMKTRNTMNEIEVRFAGETLYDYFLEIRTDDDEDYMRLQYDRNHEEDSDYGYTLDDGSRVEFYREKTVAYVEDGLIEKYVYYAKISKVRRRSSDGTYDRVNLLPNTRYYVKVWARNIEDSTHIGPVIVRTDFSQDDYDKGHLEDEIKDMFESKADSLSRKLYFTVNEPDKFTNRVLLKGAMISNLMSATGHSGVIVDISAEKPEVPRDIILVPMEILDTLANQTSRLTIKLAGMELTLTGSSVDLDQLKHLTSTAGVKETMLEITVERKKAGSVLTPAGYLYGSQVFDINFRAVGMSRTYAEINKIVYDILKEPDATGPFKYGIIDRELIKLLEKKTTLTYQNQSELERIIGTVIENIEEELSLYIRDILDGGRGLSASQINHKEVPGLTGGVILKIIHDGFQALMEPFVLPKGQSDWQKPSGATAWVFPYVLVTAKVSGQYAVFKIPEIAVPDEGGVIDPDLQRLAQNYNLQKAFGSNRLYPEDYVSGENAVNLFEVITRTEKEVTGLSTAAKIRHYKLEHILPVTRIQSSINRRQAVFLVVEMYSYKTGVPTDVMRPAAYHYIKDSETMSDSDYHRLVIAVDLGIASLDTDYSFHGERNATVGEILDGIVTMLEIVGEW